MLKINQIFFNIILSLYIFCLNYNLFAFLNAKINDFNLLVSSYIIYFLLIFIAINIACFFRFFAYIISIILIISIAFSSYFMHSYNVVIDDDMLINAMATDKREISDLLSSKMIFYIFLTMVLPLIILSLIRLQKSKIINKLLTILISTILLLGALFYSSKSLIPFLRANDSIRYYNAPFYQLYSFYKVLNIKFEKSKPMQEICLDAKMNDDNLTKTFILVVGETARAKNYSLGGYSKNDTNFYTKQHNVMYFNNFSSCGTATAHSLPCMFSIHDRADFEKGENYKNVLSVLNRFIDVYWLDNNSGGCKGVCSDVKSIIKSEDYDEWLVGETKKILENKKDKNTLIVLHLQGSHGPSYYLRYPKEFKKFSPTCDTNKLQDCSEDALYNTYDNTLLYTDYLISLLIEALKNDSSDEKALFYLSDHGESLGENGFYLHGMPYYIAPKEQIHIPAILWVNNEYINKNKLDYKLSQDNLFSSLLGYFSITTSSYKDDFDIFSPNLNKN